MATKKCFKGVYTKFRKTIIMSTFTIIGLCYIASGLYIAFEMWRAPMMDDNGKITKEGKKLSDLFKKKK